MSVTPDAGCNRAGRAFGAFFTLGAAMVRNNPGLAKYGHAMTTAMAGGVVSLEFGRSGISEMSGGIEDTI